MSAQRRLSSLTNVPSILAFSVLALTTSVVLFWFAFGDAIEEWKASRLDARAYYLLSAGLSLTDVEEVFGRKSDYSCRFGTGTVLYFFDPKSTDGGENAGQTRASGLPEIVNAIDELPYFYGSKQILLDSEGFVIAYTWMGEERHIHTSNGDFPGATLKQVPVAFFESMLIWSPVDEPAP